MKRKFLVLGILVLAQQLSASIPNKIISVEEILRLPTNKRGTALSKIGPSVYRELRRLAFDKNVSYDIRWRAVISMAWVGSTDSEKDLLTAIKDDDWFMRDAALKGLQKINPTRAKEWARELISDPALVVRTSAVQTIHDLGDVEAAKILWEKLDSPQNYRGDQSLWIRRQIVDALADLAPVGSEKKFAVLLSDQDRTLQKPAMRGLERLTGQIMSENPEVAISQWKAWISKNKMAAKAPEHQDY